MAQTDSSEQLAVLAYLDQRQQNRLTDDASIYRAIGVEPIINCRGTFTIIGGSVELPSVQAAIKEAARHFVQYDELAMAVGQRLADLTGAAWGMIPSGCAAGIKHVTAACVTGGNPELLIRIPDLTGFTKTQVIVPRYARNPYDHALRNIGVEIVMVDTPDELAHAINAKTAMIYLMSCAASQPGEPLSLEVIASIAKAAGVPVLVDAAAENLTIPCIHLEQGADVVVYSGGKAMCGPQGAGLLLGNKQILLAAWQASSPHHGPNRDNKIGREETLGMLAAVEAWLTRDHDAEWQGWLAKLDQIAKRVAAIPSVTTEVVEPVGLSNRSPTLVIRWDPAILHITGETVAEEFARKPPRIAIGSQDGDGWAALRITPSQMQPGDETVVADRIDQILTAPREPRERTLATPTVDVNGHWELTVHYFTSTSHHRLYLQQSGNWVTGVHQSEFAQQPIVGTIEGNQIKLRSEVQQPGDRIPFLFAGQVNEDGITGTIFLGEYLTATFSATRARYQPLIKPFAIPSGPPLAT